MTKFVVLAAALVACVYAQGQQVCLGQAFQFQRSSQFSGFNSSNVGFDLNTEFYDYVGKRFRSRTQAYNNGTQIFFDVIILAAQNTMYQVFSTSGGGSINCTKNTGTFQVPPACLLSNATIGGQFFIAGSVYCNAYNEQGWDNRHNGPYFEEIGMSDGTNVPIQRRRFVGGTRPFAELDLFFNYASNFPPNAFEVPSFCPAMATGRSFGVHETTEIMQHYFGAWPKRV